jgi:hypothetical protein
MRLAERTRGLAYTAGLALYLRDPHTPDRARAIVRARLGRRERNFLWIAQRAIYADRASPYRALLRHAGCEYGDLVRLVQQEGLEGALAALYRRGVYLSHAELMAKEPVRRGSLRFDVQRARLRKRLGIVPSDPTRLDAGGSPMPLYQAMFSGLTAHAVATLEARQALGWRHALWTGDAIAAVSWLLRLLVKGRPPPTWFARHDPRDPDLPQTFKRVFAIAPAVGRLVGVPIQPPVHAAFDRPTPVVDWIRTTVAAGATAHLTSPITRALVVVQTARELGVDLRGVQFTVSGEAITPARHEAIVQAGGTPYPAYGSKESGFIAHGCLAPRWPDEMHLLSDCHAVIQAGPPAASSPLPEDMLLLTTLQRWWPYVLLNVSLGDRADLSPGQCGCPLERLGWSTRLHTVRAFAKLKVGGDWWTLGALLDLLERALPARFGGGPLSYQLVQRDNRIVHGIVSLDLLVDPEVGPIDESALVALVERELTVSGPSSKHFGQRGGWIKVVRRKPYLTPAGKILQVCHESTVEGGLLPEQLDV